jgi:bifunctional non-homologous end joining protein LigD
MTPGELESYRKKRDPNKTPEPMPTTKRSRRGSAKPQFVIQEHHATALHWDFRLERDGVLVSWALPKGLPLDPGRNHLAIHTEDHPLEYSSFEGEIPKGEYGGGTVTRWDHGTYDEEKWSEREVMVVLHGTRAEGRYVLFKTARGSGGPGRDSWMIHRMDPAPAGYERVPERIAPMLCRTAELPADDSGWAYEPKWDGLRAVAYVEGGRVRFVSRNDKDVTVSFPELRELGEALSGHPGVYDGEIIAPDDQGRPSFSRLQQRMHVADATRARRLAASTPVTYMLFDVLHLDGHSTLALDYDERRQRLESLRLTGAHFDTPARFVDAAGADVFDAVVEAGMEGLVAKRRDSPYRPGERPGTWLKVKHFATQEVVIGGFTPGKGARARTIGALLLGLPGTEGLVYVGKVGTGFTDADLADLTTRLGALEVPASPFVGDLPRAHVRGARWVRPVLVGEVQFGEWTEEHRLRHPSWRGLRPDKDPAAVIAE